MRAKKSSISRIWQDYAETIVSAAAVMDDDLAGDLISAFAKVPRDYFIAERMAARAASNVSLPIGFDQIMFKPSILARMLALVALQEGDNVLQIGSGSGYLSAVMEVLGTDVFAVEQIGLLAQNSRRVLDKLGFQRVLVKPGTGAQAWVDQAPFNAIIITTVTAEIDLDLFSLLHPQCGRLVGLLGAENQHTLCLWQMNAGQLSCQRFESGNLVS